MRTQLKLGMLMFLFTAAVPLKAHPIEEGPVLGDPVSEAFEMASRNTGGVYQVTVSLPAAYRSAPSDRVFPVIYVLDGQWLFPTTSWVAVGGLFDRSLPAAIVVGITSKGPHDKMLEDRFRDFTPFPMKLAPMAGHAVEFRRFLSQELIPEIERRYKPGATRALVGLSLGGLFALDTFVSEPDLFGIYVADSPSLSFDDRSLHQRFRDLPKNFLRKPTRLYLSWGGAEALVDEVREFSRELETRKFDNLRLHTGPVGRVGHALSGTLAITEGLAFGFSRDSVPQSAKQISEYTGRYTSADGSVIIQIKARGGDLTIDFSDFGVPADNVPLKVIGVDHLLAEANFVEIWLQRDSKRQVAGAQVVIEGSPATLQKSNPD